jgi:hypothetical protein
MSAADSGRVPEWTIEPLPRGPRQSVHRFELRRGSTLVATFWHDHRGEECGLELPDGSTAEWREGNALTFLQGGGPRPLRLTRAAVAWLEEREWERQGCEICRGGWERSKPPPQVAVSDARDASLHRCPRCRTYWERRGQDPRAIDVERARRLYPVPLED